MGNKKRKSGSFCRGILLYALVLLLLEGTCLLLFWGFLKAYEASRPETAVKEYISSLTNADICNRAAPTIQQVDHTIQSETECREIICDLLKSGIHYTKDAKKSAQGQLVYELRTESAVIGNITLEVQAPGSFGFSPWRIAGEQYDFSWLLETPVEKTVPSEYQVSINGHVLDETAIADGNVHYFELEEYYGDYKLPHMVTYRAGPFLSSVETVVLNSQGKVVSFDENTDVTPFLDTCTADMCQKLDPFVKEFIERYIAYAGSNQSNRTQNFNKLAKYLQPASDLQSRLSHALAGLQYGQSYHDKVTEITTHYVTQLGADAFLCNVTWTVETIGKKGPVQTETNAHLLIVQTSAGLKVQKISNY